MQRSVRMLPAAVRLVLLAGLTAGLAILAPTPVVAASPDACRIGSYRLNDGSDIDIAPSEGNTLRWRRFDGTTGALHPQKDGTWGSTRGWTRAADGLVVSFPSCDAIRFGEVAGMRRRFDVRDVKFESHDTTLAGRLVMPPGGDKVPVVVLIHGSEHDSALEDYSLQRMLPAQGIAAFVYDKRGTGSSGGTYTQDFSLLADDAVAAVRTARSLAGARLGRIGFQAGSEGGWVTPLAASRTPVDFAIICFGLAVSVIDEDQEAVELQLSEKGYSRAQIRDALEVARAAENVFASGFSSGYAALDRLRSRYSGTRWYADLRGDYTWAILPESEAELRAMAPDYDWHTPFHYDPMPVLRSLRTPQLWILGGEDLEAPSRETRRRLKSLIAAGRDITIAYYASAEHGMTLFDADASGDRTSIRYAPGYFRLIRDFAVNGAVPGQYGNAEVTRPQVVARQDRPRGT
jgi:uncharacterized protein